MNPSTPPERPSRRQRRWIESLRPWLGLGHTVTRRILGEGLPPTLTRAFRGMLNELTANYLGDWPGAGDDPPDWAKPVAVHYRLWGFLGYDLERQTARLEQLRRWQTEYGQRHRQAVTEREREHHLLEFARQLGASRRQLAGDRRAFRRWLGHDTLVERCQRQRAACDRRLSFVLERLGFLSAWLLDRLGANLDPTWLWRRFDLEARLLPLLIHEEIRGSGSPRSTRWPPRCARCRRSGRRR